MALKCSGLADKEGIGHRLDLMILEVLQLNDSTILLYDSIFIQPEILQNTSVQVLLREKKKKSHL